MSFVSWDEGSTPRGIRGGFARRAPHPPPPPLPSQRVVFCPLKEALAVDWSGEKAKPAPKRTAPDYFLLQGKAGGSVPVALPRRRREIQLRQSRRLLPPVKTSAGLAGGGGFEVSLRVLPYQRGAGDTWAAWKRPSPRCGSALPHGSGPDHSPLTLAIGFWLRLRLLPKHLGKTEPRRRRERSQTRGGVTA